MRAFTDPAAGQSPQPYNLYRRVWLDPPARPYAPVVNPPTGGFSRINVWVADETNQPADKAQWLSPHSLNSTAETDAEFLRKVIQSARGSAPSAVEERYFAEDKDPKKREKLLDLFLKDPAVARKLGDDWKKKMLGSQDRTVDGDGHVWGHLPQRNGMIIIDASSSIVTGRDTTVRLWDARTGKAQPSRLERLVGELVSAKQADEQVLDGVSLVVLGRLPTESERRLTLAAVGKAADRRAAWVEVAKALSATEEARTHAAELNKANPALAKPPEKK
jgi:hypothetical protein